MSTHHWVLLVVTFAVAYYIGAKYPAVVSKMGM